MPNIFDKIKGMTTGNRAAAILLSGNPIAASALALPEATESGLDTIKNQLLRTLGIGKLVTKLGAGVAGLPVVATQEIMQNAEKNPLATAAAATMGPIAGPAMLSPTIMGAETLGVYPAVEKGLSDTPAPKTYSEVLTHPFKASANVLGEYFGVNAAKRAFASDDPMVQGEEGAQAFLQALPLAGVLGRAASAGRSSILRADVGRATGLGKKLIRTVDAEDPIAYAQGKLLHTDAPVQTAGDRAAAATQGAIPPGSIVEATGKSQIASPEDLLSDYQVAVIGNEVIGKLANEALAIPTKISQVVADGIKNGVLDPERLKQLVPTINAPNPSVAAQKISDAVMRTAHSKGTGLEVFSELEALREARVLIGLRKGDPAVVKAWNAAAKSVAGDSISLWKDLRAADGKALAKDVWGAFKRYEQLRRATGTSGPPTAGRNIITQAGALAVTEFDNLMAETLNRIGVFGKVSPETIDSAFVSSTESVIGALRDSWFRGGSNVPRTVKLLEELPKLEELLLSSPTSMDVKATKGVAGKMLGDTGVIDHYINTAQFMNFWQEMNFRRVFFSQRFQANLERIGLGLDEAERLLKTPLPELTPSEYSKLAEVKSGAAESYYYALKNTFSDTPVTSAGQGLLKFFQNPIATALGHPFPRFVANKLSWLSRRNPLHLLEMVDPKFRELLSSENVLERQAARDAMAQASTGLTLLTMAKAVRDSSIAGNKYYEVFDFTKEGVDRSKVTDIRSMEPFTTLLGVVDMWKSIANDKPTNLDENEYVDLIAGIRRMNDMGFVGIPTFLQSITAANQEVWQRGAARVIGGHASMWTVPITTLKRLWWDLDAASNYAKDQLSKEGLNLPDVVAASMAAGQGLIAAPLAAAGMVTSAPGTKVNDVLLGKDRSKVWAYPELTGNNSPSDVLTAPARQAMGDAPINLYNTVTGSNIPPTPSRINQWTGKPDVTFTPFATQIGGMPIRQVTPIINAMNSLGIDERELRKNYKTAEANNQFAIEFNALLKAPGPTGTTLEEELTKVLNAIASNPATQKKGSVRNTAQWAVARGILSKITKDAEQIAFAKNPAAFMPGKIENLPIPPDAKNLLRERFTELYQLQQITGNK